MRLAVAVVEREQHRRAPAGAGELLGPAVAQHPRERGREIARGRDPGRRHRWAVGSAGHRPESTPRPAYPEAMTGSVPVPLQPEDRAILELEGATVAGHACKVVVLGEGAPATEALREAVGDRLAGPRS